MVSEDLINKLAERAERLRELVSALGYLAHTQGPRGQLYHTEQMEKIHSVIHNLVRACGAEWLDETAGLLVVLAGWHDAATSREI